MGLLHGYPEVVGELVRTTATAERTLDIELLPMPVTTVRNLAHYSINIALPWLTDHRIVLITPRGQVQRYTVRAAMEWLHACMPGTACVLSVRWPDASGVARQWTPGRIAGQVNRIEALSSDRAMIAAARAAGINDTSDARAAARAMAEAGAMIGAMRGAAPWPEPAPEIVVPTMWIPDAGAPGNRETPVHAQDAGMPDQWAPTKNFSLATHVFACALRDEQARQFWGVAISNPNNPPEAGTGYPQLKISNDAKMLAMGQPGTAYGSAGKVQPENPYKDARTERYALIRLTDGAIIRRNNLDSSGYAQNYPQQPITEPDARYVALSPDGRLLGLADTIEGAHAAARAALGWTWRWGNGYGTGYDTGPVAGDPMRWVLGDLVAHTESAQETICDGAEVAGLVDDAALPVRP